MLLAIIVLEPCFTVFDFFLKIAMNVSEDDSLLLLLFVLLT